MRPPSRSSSISSLSSTTSATANNNNSTTPEAEETMQIFVKNIDGETIPLTVPPNLSTSALLTLLSLRLNLPPASLRLIHSGRLLPTTPSSTLLTSQIPPSALLHLSTPLLGGAPPKKPRCGAKDCSALAQRIVGDCGFCGGHYCAKHRLLEDHRCAGLEDCKKEGRERNTRMLEEERTVVVRGI
ncbi:MAG: hypothetical protein M1824_001912 [Vezdaea acicularis]|nr:MAG: hypothetical protein M1824_001912 [Vezdaea acicularis]